MPPTLEDRVTALEALVVDDEEISQLPQVAAASVPATALFPYVDVEDTSQAPSGTNKASIGFPGGSGIDESTQIMLIDGDEVTGDDINLPFTKATWRTSADLLDLTDPTLPTIIEAGVYAFNLCVIANAFGADDFAWVGFDFDGSDPANPGNGWDHYQDIFMPLADLGNPAPNNGTPQGSACVVGYMPAGATCQVNVRTLTGDVPFRLQGTIQRISGSGGGGSGDVSDAVILAPATSLRNVIEGTADVTELTLKGFAGQTNPQFVMQDDDGHDQIIAYAVRSAGAWRESELRMRVNDTNYIDFDTYLDEVAAENSYTTMFARAYDAQTIPLLDLKVGNNRAVEVSKYNDGTQLLVGRNAAQAGTGIFVDGTTAQMATYSNAGSGTASLESTVSTSQVRARAEVGQSDPVVIVHDETSALLLTLKQPDGSRDNAQLNFGDVEGNAYVQQLIHQGAARAAYTTNYVQGDGGSDWAEAYYNAYILADGSGLQATLGVDSSIRNGSYPRAKAAFNLNTGEVLLDMVAVLDQSSPMVDLRDSIGNQLLTVTPTGPGTVMLGLNESLHARAELSAGDDGTNHASNMRLISFNDAATANIQLALSTFIEADGTLPAGLVQLSDTFGALVGYAKLDLTADHAQFAMHANVGQTDPILTLLDEANESIVTVDPATGKITGRYPTEAFLALTGGGTSELFLFAHGGSGFIDMYATSAATTLALMGAVGQVFPILTVYSEGGGDPIFQVGPTVPTADPHSVGQVWRSGTALQVSLG